MSGPESDPGSVDALFDPIEWGEVGDMKRIVGRATALFAVGGVVLAAAFAYDYTQVPSGGTLVGSWDVTVLDWLSIASLWVLAVYLAYPLYRNRALTRRYWREVRENRVALASLVVLVAFGLVGVFGPLLVGKVESHATAMQEPPYGFSLNSILAGSCVGTEAGGRCYGTLTYPLGTTLAGKSVLSLIVVGARTALQVAVITAVVMVPLATGVGTVAAYYGGWVDEVLMGYVDIQQVIPPFFVYIVAQFLYGPSLPLMIAVFGVLGWGGMARHVRSEALKKRDLEYVKAARGAGVSRPQIVMRHVLPNVSNTVIVAATLQIPRLIVIETTLSFLGFGDPSVISWGNTINLGFATGFPTYWWVSVFPALAMTIVVAAFNLFGDALRDALDPRLRTEGAG